LQFLQRGTKSLGEEAIDGVDRIHLEIAHPFDQFDNRVTIFSKIQNYAKVYRKTSIRPFNRGDLSSLLGTFGAPRSHLAFTT